MQKYLKRLTSLGVAAVLALGGVPAQAAGAGVLTRGETAELLLNAGDSYVPGLKLTDILKGHPSGDLDQDSPVTRVQALLMLERAFGGLPAPVGNSARNAIPAGDFTDIPGWASEELADVLAAGIVDGGGDGLLSPSQPVTGKELDTLIRRVYALKGTNLRDDFYTAVNKEWLDNSKIPAGTNVSGGLHDLRLEVNKQVAKLIQDISSRPQEEGTAESKIKAFYGCVTDAKSREEDGVTPIRKYLDAIDNAKTLDELIDADINMKEELAFSALMNFSLSVDRAASNRFIIEFASVKPFLDKDFYAGGNQAQTDAYITYLTTLFTLAGSSEEEAGARARLVYEAEKPLAAASLTPQEEFDVDNIYNLYTMDKLKALFPNVDMDKVYAAGGYQETGKIVVQDAGRMETAAKLFDDAHLDTLKAVAQAGLLLEFGKALAPDFQNAQFDFDAVYSGIGSRMSDEEAAGQMVQTYLGQYLDRVYAETCFSPEAKADVEKMCRELIDVCRERIQTLDWMSDATKAKALVKLDAMKIKVGYPDSWDTYLDNAEIKSPDQGGTFFSNVIAIRKAEHAEDITLQNEERDKAKNWMLNTFVVNAGYDETANDITFPAAMLQLPFYDVNASWEENMGGIGFIIGHEITHAFDNNGGKYDETGSSANWWTDEDYSAFQEKCRKVIGWYDGQEADPGIPCDGELTISENVADLGSMQCIMTAAKKRADPDYDRIFRTLANCWTCSGTRQRQELYAAIDVHAPPKLRCNRVLQTIPEFYEIYGIQPGDGMWTEPGSRVSIW